MSKILNYNYAADKYYTSVEIVNKCLENIKNNLNINKNTDLIIEPSAGNGVFLNGIKELCNNVLAYDLHPEHKEVLQCNFLDFNESKVSKYKKIHAIGFPPIGKQLTICKKFIKKCSEFCDSISFILPMSFKRETVNRVFPKNFHLVYQEEIKEKFSVDNNDIEFPSVFQIWEKRKDIRKNIVSKTPDCIQYVTKTEKPHLSIVRIGDNAGELSKSYRDQNPQTHLFIRVVGMTIDNFIEKFKTIEFDTVNSVGPKSISKTEINKKLTNIL